MTSFMDIDEMFRKLKKIKITLQKVRIITINFRLNFTFDKVFERISNTIYEYEFRHSVEIISNDDDPVYKVDENKATDLSEMHFFFEESISDANISI